MIPKEKAKELVNSYWVLYYDKHDINSSTKKDAIQSASIAADVMSNICKYKKEIEYWHEVKAEIEAL
jgi:hypothetical protein